MFDLLSPIHLVLLLVIILLVFGPKRLPEIGSGLGKGIREFRRALNDITGEARETLPAATKPDDDLVDRN
jgi:sec-independent protein translocase protein TatA